MYEYTKKIYNFFQFLIFNFKFPTSISQLPSCNFHFPSYEGFTFLEKKQSRVSGFTLIELLVVFSLIAILSGVGYASFADYSRLQQVNQTANNIELFITEARSDALSVVNPNINSLSLPCPTLVGYDVKLNLNQLELYQECDTNEYLMKVLKLPNTLSFDTSTSCNTISFATLTAQGGGLPCNFVIKGYTTLKKSVCVDAGGNAAVKDSC